MTNSSKSKVLEKNRAISFFHRKPENYNCAQAILLAFQEEFNIDDEKVHVFKAFGGGRAPKGYCGALYAALSLDLPQEVKNEIESKFIQAARFITCREIKINKTLSCIECVQLAENIVNQALVLQEQE